MPGTAADYDVLEPTGKTIAEQWPSLYSYLGAYVKLLASMTVTGSPEPADTLTGFILGNNSWWVLALSGAFLVSENTGTPTVPIWTVRFQVNPGGAAVIMPSHTHATADIISGTMADARIALSNITQYIASLDHNALLNFVANKHIDHSAVSISPGTGLTGGGDLTATRTLTLANTAVTPATYGPGTILTVDAQGRLTAASTPNRLLAKKTTAQTPAAATETNVTDLTGLTIPGANGTRKYRVFVNIATPLNGAGAERYYNVKLYVGTNGNLSDTTPVLVQFGTSAFRATGGGQVTIPGFEITPATSAKIGVTVTDETGQAMPVAPATTGQSWIEVVECA